MKKASNMTNAIISFTLFAGILVFINFFAGKYFKRLDMTKNKKYSITEGTKETLKTLPSNLIIKAYFSKDMPAPYNELIDYASDMLKEFEVYGKGKINLEFIIPEEMEEKEKFEVQRNGIQPIQAEVLKNDKFELKKGYMGAVFYYEDKKEVIPVMGNIANLEYDIVTKLIRLTEEKRTKVGIMSFSEQYKFDNLKNVLGENYEVVDIEAKDGKINDEDISLLIVTGGEKEPEDLDLFAVDQYVLSGKPVMFMLDRYDVSLETLTKSKINDKLLNLVKNYGVTVGDQMVYDENSRVIMVSQKEGFFNIRRRVNFPFIGNIVNLNKENPALSSLNDIGAAFVTPISFEEKEGRSFEWLYKSSEKSYETNPYSLNPSQKVDIDEKSKKGPFILAGAVSGKFDSYYKDKEKPEGAPEEVKSGGVNNRVLVFSDTNLIEDGFADQKNLHLIQNTVDWLTKSESLLKIRTKNVSIANLKELPLNLKRAVRYINLSLMPFMIVLLGIFVLFGRKRSEVKVYE